MSSRLGTKVLQNGIEVTPLKESDVDITTP